MENSTILELEHISKRYATGRHALKDVSLKVQRGEVVAIIGPSGAGKSTLLRSINRLIDVSEGSVLVEGEDITHLNDKNLRRIRRKIGMIFQNYNLVYRLSVFENILHGHLGYLSGLRAVLGIYEESSKQKAANILKQMGLSDFMYTRASDLSGGQKQRVGIARALMQEPHIFLCDEPISSLDPSSAKTVMDIIQKLSLKNNIACLVNLHQVAVAQEYATRIVGLNNGQIVFDGPPEKLTHETIETIYQASYDRLMMGQEAMNG